MISHMNNNDTNDSKYTTDSCDTEQHKPDKEECHDIETKDNHFEPSEIVLSDKCMPIIMSAMLGENNNKHYLDQNCFDERDSKIVFKMMVHTIILILLLQHMLKTKTRRTQ